MLVLSRREGEEILIHKDGELLGTIMVVSINGPAARIGLNFSKEYDIVRKEVHLRSQPTQEPPVLASEIRQPAKAR